MIYVEFEGDFESEDEMLGVLQDVVSRLIVDPDTGEVMGFLSDDDLDSEINVKVPEHIVDWAKKEPQ